jgi:hypothetical protein
LPVSDSLLWIANLTRVTARPLSGGIGKGLSWSKAGSYAIVLKEVVLGVQWISHITRALAWNAFTLSEVIYPFP